MADNSKLMNAKKVKNDEFYTEYSTISNEMGHYREQLKGQIVYCNCDDPYESNFFKYFAMNFNSLGLKKLIATGYVASPIAGTELVLPGLDDKPVSKNTPYVAYINEVPDLNGDGRRDLEDVKILLKNVHNTRRKLKGEVIRENGNMIEYAPGDFRSSECITLLKQADIVVTNPPFSLFREYVALLMKHKKKFIILGNPNAITYKEIFPLIQTNKLWLGNKSMGTDMLFDVPSHYAKDLVQTKKEGSAYRLIDGIVKGRTQAIWFTNLDIVKRHENLDLCKEYNPEDYPKYDNYDAINVNKVVDIPKDYDGIMGVPITFLDKYNPDQFEIVGEANHGSDNKFDLFKPIIGGKLKFKRLLIRRRK